MSSIVRHPIAGIAIAGIAAAALLAGWAAGVGAQTNTAAPAAPPVATLGQPAAPNYPPLPLGHDDIREVQNQLIALGFDPGTADGQAGPATQTAAQQYDRSRGGNGQVAIDSALLARLKADTAPRLSYEQVAAHSHASAPAQAQASASSGANQIGGIIQQLAPLIGAAINSSNNYGGGYGYGGYPGPGYYGPPPVYGGYPYGY
jgi:peptidoglycan hydrolase-like protein with peptidoglycan-binding domain